MASPLLQKIPGAHAIHRLKSGIKARREAKSHYEQDFVEFRRLAGSSPRLSIRTEDRYPCLTDRTATTGFDRHYVYHTAWAARVLAETLPTVHHDFSSSLYFAGLVSAFVPIRFYDYRPADLQLNGLESLPADLTRLPFETASLQSVSCMHVIEHVGLGRYGDPLDPDGDLKALKELGRITSIGGTLLVVTPVGRPRIQFNAHRIYAPAMIIDQFPQFHLVDFTLIPEDGRDGGLVRNPDPELVARQTFGCGCFRFVRHS